MASTYYIEFIILLVSFFLLLIIRFLIRRNNPNLPFDWPFFGMLSTILINYRRSHEKITEVLERNDGTFVLKGPWFTNTDKLITCDLDNANHVLSTNFSNYPKGAEAKRVFDVLGDFLFNADDDEWNEHRKIIRAFFSDPLYVQSTMKQDRKNIQERLIPVLDHFSSKGLLVDLQDIFNRFLLDSSCTLATGYDPRALSIEFPEIPLAEAIHVAADRTFYRYQLPEWLWGLQRRLGFSQEKEMRKAMKVIDEIAETYITKKQQDIKRGIKSFDALSFFMTRPEAFQEGTNKAFLRDIVMLLVTAGRDTVASTLSWYFWLISQNQRVISKIRKEIEDNNTNKGGHGTHHDEEYQLFNSAELIKLPYLHASFCETLRLYPPTYQVRVPVKPDTLPTGHRVNPKMKVILTWYALGRMPSVWGNDCLEFKPERWISEKGEFKNDLATKLLFSFSNGPRVCPGKSDSFARMKVIASAIIQNYNIQVMEGQSISPALSLVLHMDPGLMVRITKRKGLS